MVAGFPAWLPRRGIFDRAGMAGAEVFAAIAVFRMFPYAAGPAAGAQRLPDGHDRAADTGGAACGIAGLDQSVRALTLPVYWPLQSLAMSRAL